ncbi:hypothetical protein KR074_004614, partial [Drosophila pseudoananassae]
CYCGKGRNLDQIEFLCFNCSCWIHEPCVTYQLLRKKIHLFTTNYIFICKNCSLDGVESYDRHQASPTQMAHCAIANMQHVAAKIGMPQIVFSMDKDIIPYIEKNWQAMTTLPRLQTQSWKSNVIKCLKENLSKQFIFEDNPVVGLSYGLALQDLLFIQPRYEGMSLTYSYCRAKPSSRGQKVRPCASKMDFMPYGFPREYPYNKNGFSYILAEPDPHAREPEQSDVEPSSSTKRVPIPGWMYRVKLSPTLLLSLHDCAGHLSVTEDRLAVTGERGYGMVRATHSVSCGCWYFEVTIIEMPGNASTRLGWGRRHANLQTPLGCDKFGYSWRSRKGTKFTESRGKHYTDAYGEGDTLGFLINLPYESQLDYKPKTYKNCRLIKSKSHMYFEDDDKSDEKLEQLYELEGSRIEFFKNGVSQGVAFEKIYAGSYYPTISIYRSCTLSVNFGPTFKYPEVLSERKARAMHERVDEMVTEQFLADTLYLAQHN